MKTKVLSIILLGASLGLGSCSDYLDMTPTDRASDKLVWSKLDYAEQAVNDLDRKSTRLNSSHLKLSRMPSSA